jgi:hypothetical protein
MEVNKMALNRKSKVKEILASPEACEILQKHVPSFETSGKWLGPAMMMSIQAILANPKVKCPKEAQEAFFDELGKANIG